ncbi:hypothetical protein BWI17_14020 [Betaproteobacteria bacterium GR16-43]|nr:hypothetical protein BWI17_14020 [Betaproteobacteria bacterium GR16-43]
MNPSAYQAFARHVNPPLARYLALSGRDQRFARASACEMETDAGEVYTDWIAGFGSLNLGHNPPALVEAARAHLASGVPNLFLECLNPVAGLLAERLVQAAGPGFATAYLCNSGTEAVEAAVKLAMAATGRRGIVYCEGAYHGTTLGSLSMMADGEYRAPFEPLLPHFRRIPFGDLDALATALDAGPAALVIEPIQVEKGVRALPGGFLARAKALCHDHGALLILDEAQTGMGRTGSLFAFQEEGVAPDVLVLAKALGGGVVPLAAMVAGEGLFERAYGDPLRCEIHNSTFGGNSLACQVGLEALARLASPEFLDDVRARAAELARLLEAQVAHHPLVERCFVKGFLGGIRLREGDHPWFTWSHWGMDEFAARPAMGALLVHRLHRRRILAQVCAHDWSSVRIEPPLVVTVAQCQAFVAALREELDWIAGHG